jgi:hypothetical protein
MRHTTRQYLAALDTETLITVIEGLCGFGGFDVNHGPDPDDGKPIVYGSHHLHGTVTLANVDNAWSIDMDPKKTTTVRIEGDFDKVCDLLSEAVHREINAYEITKMPEDQSSSKVVPKWAETGTARFVCNNLWKPEKNTAIMSLQFDTENNLPPDVQAQELVNNINDTTYFRVRLESVIPADNGCGCMQDPPCKGCKTIPTTGNRSMIDYDMMNYAMGKGVPEVTVRYWKDWLESRNAVLLTPEEFHEFILTREKDIDSTINDSLESKWIHAEPEDYADWLFSFATEHPFTFDADANLRGAAKFIGTMRTNMVILHGYAMEMFHARNDPALLKTALANYNKEYDRQRQQTS